MIILMVGLASLTSLRTSTHPTLADLALTTLQAFSEGKQAAKIGLLSEEQPHLILETELGGERFLEELEDEPLPRIC
jgi:hydrogenase expression/formation protein HypE